MIEPTRDWSLILQYYTNQYALQEQLGVMTDALALIECGMRDSGVWLLEKYLSEVEYETHLQDLDPSSLESNQHNNGVGPLGW